MSKAVFVLAAALCLSGCQPSDPISASPGSLQVQLSDETIALGQACTLTVVQDWQEGLDAPIFDQSSLSPLVLQLGDTVVRSSQGLVREQRVYRAYAFELGELQWPQYGLKLLVSGTLEPGQPGAVELPGDVLPLPRSWGQILLRVFVLLLLAWMSMRYFRRWRLRLSSARALNPTAVEQIHPADRALAKLQDLLATPGESAGQVQASFVEISRILRTYLAEQFAVPALEMTQEQLHAFAEEHELLTVPERDCLEQILLRCDQVKFADFNGDDSYRQQTIDLARQWINCSQEFEA